MKRKYVETKEDLERTVKRCKPLSWFRSGKSISVNDKMQSGYRYTLKENAGKNFDSEFKPQMSPKKMLEMGIFEGKYLNDTILEFPKEWFTRRALRRMNPEEPDPSLNFYKIKSRLSLQEWYKRGWIPCHPKDKDVRGWFQWYCRYWIGRRIPEVDSIQIKRWKNFKRHLAQVQKNCPHISKNCRNGGKVCRPKQRQALLQWAYDPRRV